MGTQLKGRGKLDLLEWNRLKGLWGEKSVGAQGSSLRSRALTAGVWTAGGFAAQKLFQLGSNLLLTRLLFPEAFGLMALAHVILIGLAMFSDVGIKPAIIQNDRGEDQAFLNTAWSIQVLRGFILWAVAAILAYPVSILYGQSELFPLVIVLGAASAISGFASTSLAIGERRLSVRGITLIQLSGQVAALVLTAALAWELRSVWALAYGALIGAAVTTVLSYAILPTHRHRFVLERDAFQTLFQFGRWIFLGTLVTFLGGQGLRAIQGVYLSSAELGIVAIAQTLAWMPGDLATQLMSVVGFPSLAEVRKRGHAELVRVLASMRSKVLGMALPVFVALSLASGPIINILYDPRYEAAGDYLAIISFTGAVSVISIGYQNALMAMGNTRLHFDVLTFAMIARVAGLITGFQIGGVTGMLIGIGCGSICAYLFVAFHAKRLGLLNISLDAACFAVITAGAFISWTIYA
ncbi:MAG: oligosaccharide flippase family protein [Patescibacteria group bacterium]